MLRIFHNTNYDFIRWWKWAVGLTVAFLLVGLVSYLRAPINYSIEFTGGTLMQVEFTQPLDVSALRTRLSQAGIPGAEITQFGSPREFTIRAQEPPGCAQDAGSGHSRQSHREHSRSGVRQPGTSRSHGSSRSARWERAQPQRADRADSSRSSSRSSISRSDSSGGWVSLPSLRRSTISSRHSCS